MIRHVSFIVGLSAASILGARFTPSTQCFESTGAARATVSRSACGANLGAAADLAQLARTARPAGLETLRAGAPAACDRLDEAERAALRAAEARSPALGELRAAGLNLSDRELKIAAIAAGIVLVIVLIA